MAIFKNFNTFINVFALIVVGVWIPLFVAYYLKRMDRRREEYRLREIEEYKYERARKNRYLSNNEIDIERYLPKLIEEIPYRTSKEVSNAVSAQINRLLKDGLQEQSLQLANKIESYQINKNSNFTSNQQLIREIAHSLNTPLSQIEASAEILATTSEVDKNNIKTINAIKSSVDLCKAFISAYRQMILITGYSGGWEPKSIKESLQSACEIYSGSVQADLDIVVEMPDKIKGYSNNYIVALLLPLIENATEAAIAGSQLYIHYQHQTGNNVIQITNSTQNMPIGKEIFNTEFSTKNNHQGLGLSTVKNLLDNMEGASIDYHINGNKITFELKLRGSDK